VGLVQLKCEHGSAFSKWNAISITQEEKSTQIIKKAIGTLSCMEAESKAMELGQEYTQGRMSVRLSPATRSRL
jgi:hypothetical protein